MWKATKSLHGTTATTAWRAYRRKALHTHTAPVCIFSLFTSLLSIFWGPSGVLSPSLAWDESWCCIPDVTNNRTMSAAAPHRYNLPWFLFGRITNRLMANQQQRITLPKQKREINESMLAHAFLFKTNTFLVSFWKNKLRKVSQQMFLQKESVKILSHLSI